MEFKKYIQYLIRPTSLFVAVNITVSIIGFLRSFAFMKWLGLEELGLISLVQTVIQFIGLFQFGLINGGYRMFSLNKVQEQEKVNNLLFTFLGLFLFIFLIVWLIIVAIGRTLLMNNDLLLVAIFTGIITLANNWLNNTLVGKQKLGEINKINLISIGVSLLSLPLIYYFGFWGALISVIVHPLCFVFLTLKRNKELRPSRLFIDPELIKEILHYGFIPFLSGIFVMLNLQVERWSIAAFLGKEELGRFYLVFLFHTLFMLIPTSVQSVFFPRAVRSYDEGNLFEFNSVIKKLSIVITIYDLAIVIVTILLLKPVVSAIFPLHVDNVIYVFMFLPGLLAWSLDSILSLILNSSLRLNVLLYAGLVGFLTNIIGIIILITSGLFTLERIACLKSVVLIIPFVFSLIYVYHNKGDIAAGYKKSK